MDFLSNPGGILALVYYSHMQWNLLLLSIQRNRLTEHHHITYIDGAVFIYFDIYLLNSIFIAFASKIKLGACLAIHFQEMSHYDHHNVYSICISFLVSWTRVIHFYLTYLFIKYIFLYCPSVLGSSLEKK